MLRASNAVNYEKFSVACQKLDVNENEETETFLDVCKVDVVVINLVIITLSVSLSLCLLTCLSVFLPPLFFSLLGLNKETETFLDVCKVDVVVINQVMR
jgi:hypothetical protein